jgi:Lon protease-like protein
LWAVIAADILTASSDPRKGPPMAVENRTLPLFPLDLVLFPNAVIPLTIFEERYKLMIRRCLDGDSEFGVVLIKTGSEVGESAEPHSVGTVARIIDVQHLGDERMRIAVAGRDRFRIEAVTRVEPYLEGRVEVLHDDPADGLAEQDMDSLRTAATQHIRLLHGLRGGWVNEPRLPAEPSELSYFVAVLLQSANPEKQALLEEGSTAARLRAEHRLMQDEVEELKRRVARQLLGGGRGER